MIQKNSQIIPDVSQKVCKWFQDDTQMVQYDIWMATNYYHMVAYDFQIAQADPQLIIND